MVKPGLGCDAEDAAGPKLFHRAGPLALAVA